MKEMTFPGDLVEEAADLLDRPPNDLEPNDILAALRRGRTQGREAMVDDSRHVAAAGEGADEDVARMNLERFHEVAELYEPIHSETKRQLMGTEEGRRILAAGEQLETKMRDLREKLQDEQVTRAQAQMHAADLLERFRLEHQKDVLRVAVDHPELAPSAEVVLSKLHPDRESLRGVIWEAQIAPFQSLLLQPQPADDDVGVVKQGLGDPSPPSIGVCKTVPYVSDWRRNWEAGVGTNYSDAMRTVGEVYVFNVGFLGGGASCRALVGGDEIHTPAGLRNFRAEVTMKYTYRATCWAALFAASGAGGQIWVEVDKGDGGMEYGITPLFSIFAAVCTGQSANESSITRTFRVPFTRSDDSAGVVTVMAGVNGHAEGALSAYADMTLSATVQNICVYSV